MAVELAQVELDALPVETRGEQVFPKRWRINSAHKPLPLCGKPGVECGDRHVHGGQLVGSQLCSQPR